MSVKEERSLLELSIEFLQKNKEPQNIDTIIREVMAMTGLKGNEAKEKAPQFVLDFMLSGNFVYCGEDKWDLKYRQPTSVLDKDGGDYEDFYQDDEDVKNNELKDDTFESYEEAIGQNFADDEDDDDDDEQNNDSDDLSNEFEDLVPNLEEEEDDSEEF